MNPLHGEQQPLPALPALRERDTRLDALKLLAGRLAHEFNNSLAPLLGYVALIKEETNPDSVVLQYALAMESSARKTEEILENVMMATRPMRRFHGDWVDFQALLTEVLAAWQTAAANRKKISVRSELCPCRLYADAAQWRLSLQQLLRNAEWAMPAGGSVTVRLAAAQLSSAEATNLGLAVTDVYQLTVTDTGIGMETDTARRAFEPFFSTRPKSEAAGLGLALVHSVVRCHGGQIILESDIGKGTTVSISMPASTEETTDAAPSRAVEEPAGPPTILLVDDDHTVLEVTREFLEQAGFRTLVAIDGRRGEITFREHQREISLVIADLTMPHMNGVEMVKALRAYDPEVPVILVSGADAMTREMALTELGPDSVTMMTKPFLMKELMQAIERNVAKRRR